MKRIRTIIVEDEKPSIARLKKFLQVYDDIEMLEEAEDGFEAIKIINELKPDLVFLDIKLPIHNGFQILAQLNNDPIVIFTTAYDEYAINAFEVNAVDYLLKPYTRDRLDRALQKVRRLYPENSMTDEKLKQLQEGLEQKHIHLTKITVRKGFVYYVLDLQDVDYFKMEGGLLFVHTIGESYMLDIALKRLENSLPPKDFFRCHRNCIVNLTKVQKVIPWGRSTYKIEITNGRMLDLSRDKMKEFRLRIGML
jgi:DNA-binding LytR/AlgR family response regulator